MVKWAINILNNSYYVWPRIKGGHNINGDITKEGCVNWGRRSKPQDIRKQILPWWIWAWPNDKQHMSWIWREPLWWRLKRNYSWERPGQVCRLFLITRCSTGKRCFFCAAMSDWRLITNSRNSAFTGGFWNLFFKKTSQVNKGTKNLVMKRLPHETLRLRNSPTCEQFQNGRPMDETTRCKNSLMWPRIVQS